MGNPEILPPDFGAQFKQSLGKVDEKYGNPIPTGAADNYPGRKPDLKIAPDKVHYGTASHGKEIGTRGSRTNQEVVKYDPDKHGKAEGKPLTKEDLAKKMKEGQRRREMYEKAQAEFEANERMIAEGRFKNKKSWQVIAEAIGWEKKMVHDPSVQACVNKRELLLNALMDAGLGAFKGNDRKMAQFLDHYDKETISNRTRNAEVDMRAESSLTGRALVGFANLSKNFRTWVGSKYQENGKTTLKSFAKGMATSAGISIAIATALGAALPALGIAALGLSAGSITAIGMRGFGALGAGYSAKKKMETAHLEKVKIETARRVEAKLALIKQKTDLRWKDIVNGLENRHKTDEQMTVEDREAAFGEADAKHKLYAILIGGGTFLLGSLISHFAGEIRASETVQSARHSVGHALDKVVSLWGGMSIGPKAAYAADISTTAGKGSKFPPIMGDSSEFGPVDPKGPEITGGKGSHEFKVMADSSAAGPKNVGGPEIPTGEGAKAGQAIEKLAEANYKVEPGDTTYGILKNFIKANADKCGFDPKNYPGMSKNQALEKFAASKTMGQALPNLLDKFGLEYNADEMSHLRHIIHPGDKFHMSIGKGGIIDVSVDDTSGRGMIFDTNWNRGSGSGGHEAVKMHHGAGARSSASEIPSKGRGSYNAEEAGARKGVTRSPREIAAQKILDENAKIREYVLQPDELDAQAHSMAMDDLRTNYEYLQHVMKKSIGNSFRLSEKVENVAEAVKSFATLPSGSLPENLTFAEGEYNQKSAKFLAELFKKFPYRPGQDMRDYLIKIPHEKIVELRNIYKL
ncbi:MAG: hypothetical protein WC858_02915 [Parcubacteria group bacterium]|jgi:hypothetical protein